MLSRLFRYLIPNILATCVAFGLLGHVLAQESAERVVKMDDVEHITDAVMISSISVAGKTVECGLFIKPPAVLQPVTPFEAGANWLQQMSISLINRTNKTIVFGGLIFHFLDTGDCKSLPCVGTDLYFGQIPAIDAYDGRTGRPRKPENPEKPPIAWKPEQTIIIHVNDYIAEVEEDLSNFLPISAVRRVNIYRGAFYFADGMKWSLGRYSVPDPAHHGKFKPLPANYFPGRRGHNWPPGYSQ